MTMSACGFSRQQHCASCSGRLPAAYPHQSKPPLSLIHRSLPPGRVRGVLVRASDSEWGSDGSEDDDAAQPPAQRTQRFNFVYMNDDAALEMQQGLDAAREKSMEEYEELKAVLLRRTWRFGALFAGYLLLSVSADAAAAELIGAAAGYGYLVLLTQETDAFTPDTPVPLKAAEAVEAAPARAVAKLFAAYRQAVRPRLLIPAGLMAACAAWNATLPEWQLGLLEQACMLGGFAAYKVALLQKTYDDLKPRGKTEDEMMQSLRPRLEPVEDVTLDIKRPSQMRADAEAAAAAAAVAGDEALRPTGNGR